MDTLVLCHRGQVLREFAFSAEPLEVGRAPGCDIVVHGADVEPRKWLVTRCGEAVVAYDLARAGSGRITLQPGAVLPVGDEHSLLWAVRAGTLGARPAGTDPLGLRPVSVEAVSLLVGTGPGARRYRVGTHPVRVGSASDNDLVIPDRTVSAHHCRLDPYAHGFVLRDLNSRNGTWVDGVAVDRVRIGPRTTVRVGRTDLVLLGADSADRLVAQSPAMREVLAHAVRYGRIAWPVLVVGESGVGKEGVARAIHDSGPRAHGPFVAVNAAGFSPQLMESQLFGHERGAFTGAQARHRGVFEQADGGTLFLDEVGELPRAVQASLLRTLEGWRVRRLGGEGDHPVNVRLVCATHRDLATLAREGRFREDLYYRLARLVLQIPPLRERPEDVAPLAARFLADAREEVGGRQLSERAHGRLLAHGWPGNVRELRNVVSAAAALTPARVIEAPDIERALATLSLSSSARDVHWDQVVEAHGGNLSSAARTLGVPRTTLRDRVRRAQRTTYPA